MMETMDSDWGHKQHRNGACYSDKMKEWCASGGGEGGGRNKEWGGVLGRG